MPRVTGRQPAQALASFAVVGVALVAVVLAVGNLALWLYAQNTVIAAAQEAAVVASRENGTPARWPTDGAFPACRQPGAER